MNYSTQSLIIMPRLLMSKERSYFPFNSRSSNNRAASVEPNDEILYNLFSLCFIDISFTLLKARPQSMLSLTVPNSQLLRIL